MDLYKAIAANAIPVTSRLMDIAEACTLCGICDKQCYFITGLRPLVAMKALKIIKALPIFSAVTLILSPTVSNIVV